MQPPSSPPAPLDAMMDQKADKTGKDESSGSRLKERAQHDEAMGATEKESPRGAYEPPVSFAPPPGTEVPLGDCFEEKECRICYSPFDAESRAPGQLGCHHTFCLDCLSQMYRAQRGGIGPAIQCPLCRHLTALLDGCVDSLLVAGTSTSTSNAQLAMPRLPFQNRLQPHLLPSGQAAEPAPQRPLSEQGGEGTAPSPPPVAALAATSSAEAGLKELLRKILPWEWLAFCLLLAMLFSVAFLGPTLWKLSPWLLFLSLSLCCILPCGLVVGYRKIRKDHQLH